MKKPVSPVQILPLRIAIVLLAAGEGSRLGSHPKALLKKDGQTLLERFLRSTQAFSPVEFIVVTGFHGRVIEAELARINRSLTYPAMVLRNPSPENGQTSSVRLALESLKSEFDVVFIALSDQPQIGDGEIQALLDEFSRRNIGEEMIMPMLGSRRGNPVLFSKKTIEEILGIPNLACRAYMDAHPEKVRVMQTGNPAFVLDVDTLEDMRQHKLILS